MLRVLCLMALLAPLPARAEAPPAHVIAVGKELWRALGGDDGWQRARYLRFDWIVERDGKRVVMRSHRWDRWSGRYRVDGVDKEGPYSVYFDVKSRAGVAFVGGKRVPDGAAAKKWLDDGYEAYINDSYWLLAPFKIFDPGVVLADGGQDKGPHGEACDILKLSFENVGLTPKDVYWLYVDRATHLVVEWKFVLGGEAKPPAAYAWSDWKKVGTIELSSMRSGIGKASVIRFENLEVSTAVDDAALTPPK